MPPSMPAFDAASLTPYPALRATFSLKGRRKTGFADRSGRLHPLKRGNPACLSFSDIVHFVPCGPARRPDHREGAPTRLRA
jgi:hypothetical protein